MSKGLSIQSVNFESFRSSYAGVQSDLCISGTSTIKPVQQQIQNQNNINSNRKPNSSTPLLDNAQIDSDHDNNLETPRQNRMSIDENKS